MKKIKPFAVSYDDNGDICISKYILSKGHINIKGSAVFSNEEEAQIFVDDLNKYEDFIAIP